MITGNVNSKLEAIVQLTIEGAGQTRHQIDVVIDTGFSGQLTLPAGLIGLLQLAWLCREQGMLADGSIDLFDVYRAILIWDGQHRTIDVHAVDTQPLIGMALLERHSLHIDIERGGTVTITPFP